jgi:hypothetical protein
VFYQLLAYVVFGAHLAFILVAPFGGIAALRWPRIIWLHIPVAAWGVVVSFANWTCPLTPLEVFFLRAAGNKGYESGFLEHYVFPAVNFGSAHPRLMELAAGAFVLLANVVIYATLLKLRHAGRAV